MSKGFFEKKMHIYDTDDNRVSNVENIAISDLDKEDGSFHTEDTGLYHFGFERDAITSVANLAGF